MGKSQKLGNMPNAPAFSAYRASSNQSVTTGTWKALGIPLAQIHTSKRV